MIRLLLPALLSFMSVSAWAKPATAPAVETEDPRISPEALPEPILAAIEARWAGADIQRAVMEKKNFLVDLTARGGDAFTILVTAKGKIKRVDTIEKKEPDELEPGSEEEEEPGEDG